MHRRLTTIGIGAVSTLMGVLFLSQHTVWAATVPAVTKTVAPKEVVVWQWETSAKKPVQVRAFMPLPFEGTPGSIAVGDLGSDGLDEVVVGSGFGTVSTVRILRADGSEIGTFAPFEPTMLQGINVALGDLDGDGKAEIVVGTGPGADARVRVFDALGNRKIFTGADFDEGLMPFAKDFRGGVNVVVADVDGDGKADLITSAGPTGGPEIKIWNGDGLLLGDYFAFDNADAVGLNIAAGDLDGDGKAEIVAALSSDRLAYVRIFSGTQGTRTGEFMSIGGGFSGGLNLAVGDVNGDGANDVIVAPNGGGGPHVHAYTRQATSTGVGYGLLGAFFAYPESYRGGVLLATGRFSADATSDALVTVPAERTMDGRPQLAKYINVDVSDQRMRVFEYGQLVKTILVATGMKNYDSPIGDFKVLEKPLMVNYKWTYSPGNPDNYDLGWVKWNLRFYPHIYIHNAPWRKVFGVRGSHGCVNVDAKNAEWIYNWAEVGTPVTVQL